jgi:hypothetical protein
MVNWRLLQLLLFLQTMKIDNLAGAIIDMTLDASVSRLPYFIGSGSNVCPFHASS